MRFVVVINNDEAVDNGDVLTTLDVCDEVSELLRSGYIEVEEFYELDKVRIIDND